MTAVSGQILLGLADPVQDAQRIFRDVLAAMAHPGRIVRPRALPEETPAGLSPAAAALCLTLLDVETPLWLADPSSVVRDYLVFHCGCPIVSAKDQARFALIDHPAAVSPITAFAHGTDEHPEWGATLIVEVAGLTNEGGVTLSGPGIADRTRLDVAAAPADFWDQLKDSQALFPRGVDLILTHGRRLVALPRSLSLEV